MKPVDKPDTESETTGLPWPHSWRGVYLFVTGVFVLWVGLLTLFMKLFA